MTVAFSIGLSGLHANQKAIEVIGQNVANANTPDYHRQVVDLASRTYGPGVGSGVEVRTVRQLADSLLDRAVAQNATESATLEARLGSLRQLEATLAPSEGSLQDQLEAFFNQLELLAAQPGDVAQRRVVLGSAGGLTRTLNALGNDLATMRAGQDDRLRRIVEQVNTLAPQVAELNQAIQQATIQGIPANDLKDQRTQLLGRLGQFMDLRVVPQDHDAVLVIAGGAPLVVGNVTTPLQFVVNANGDAAVRPRGASDDLLIREGQIGAALTMRNGDLKDYRQRLDTLAQAIVRQLDAIHATGLGLTGPAALLVGQRPVTNMNAPLALVGLGFPLGAGELHVAVTDLATGERTLSMVAVDPATQSLNDFAAAFTAAVGNAQAVVDPQTRTLRVLARPGYGVDFAGRLPTVPQTSTLTGTAVPSFGGRYTGDTNDTYTFEMAGTGVVGQTSGLTLNVRDGSGALVTTLQVGQGYEPGSDLPSVNGVTVRLSAGTVNAGEQFATPVVADPDPTGILVALEVNTLFVGDNATNVAVRPDLLAHPEEFAAGLTASAGDGGNLARMAAARDRRDLGDGTQTFREFYAAMVGDLGAQIQNLGDQQDARQSLGENLAAQRQAVSGVDTNEELLRLLQFQRGFQMSSQYLAVVNQTLDELANILR